MEEEEIEYIRGVAARKVKRLSADDKTASRRPAASKGARARSRSHGHRALIYDAAFAVFRRSHPPRNFERRRKASAQRPRSIKFAFIKINLCIYISRGFCIGNF